jgi:hypothetical protein
VEQTNGGGKMKLKCSYVIDDGYYVGHRDDYPQDTTRGESFEDFESKYSKNKGLSFVSTAQIMIYWTCSITRLVIEQVLQNAPHFAVF